MASMLSNSINFTTTTGIVVVVTTLVALLTKYNNKRKKKDTQTDDVCFTMRSCGPPKDSTFKLIYNSRYKIRYTDSSSLSKSDSSPPRPLPSSPDEQKNEKKPTTITLVFVHGFNGCLETWNLLKQQLLLLENAEFSFRLVALDLLGSGFSDKPDEGGNGSDGTCHFNYTLRSQGKALVEFMKEMDLLDNRKHPSSYCGNDDGVNEDNNLVVLVSHSSGGIVVCAAAQQILQETSNNDGTTVVSNGGVDGLFFIAPGFFNSKPNFFSYPLLRRIGLTRFLARKMNESRRGMLKRMLHDRKHEETLLPEIFDSFEAASKAPDAIRALESFIVASEGPYPDTINRLLNTKDRPRIHIVWSDQDKVNPCAADKIEAMALDRNRTLAIVANESGIGNKQSSEKTSPPFTYKLLQGSGHYIQHEIPDQLADEIKQFSCRILAIKQKKAKMNE